MDCSTCDGNGEWACPDCGAASRPVTGPDRPGSCPRCGGIGSVICPSCGGTGYLEQCD